jgi:AcrR family transcriptional regulator
MTAPADPPRLTRRQQQAAETRRRMLAAARTVFEQRGYQTASVALITRAAETAHGTFYLYFKNKDDAFVQVLADILSEVLDEQRARFVEDREAGVEGAIRGYLIVFARHAPLYRALLEGVLQSPEIAAVWRRVVDEFVSRVARRLDREQEAGRLRRLDSRPAAQALVAMVEWYAFGRLLADPAGPPLTDVAVDEAVATLADLWVHAVYGRLGSESG